MLRLSRAVIRPFSANIKSTTGLKGVPVVANAREVLLGLYAKTLEEIKVIPESAQYRQGVEQISNFRLKVVQENDDCNKIEALINDGQVEELIEQAEAELNLIPTMADWKPWESAQPEPPTETETPQAAA